MLQGLDKPACILQCIAPLLEPLATNSAAGRFLQNSPQITILLGVLLSSWECDSAIRDFVTDCKPNERILSFMSCTLVCTSFSASLYCGLVQVGQVQRALLK